MRVVIRLFVITVAIVACPQPNFADSSSAGLIPSVETICEGLKGAAYGLCIAGCESALIEKDTTSSAFAKISANFSKNTGTELPCLSSPSECPCDNASIIDRAESIGLWVSPNFVVDFPSPEDTQSSCCVYRDVTFEGSPAQENACLIVVQRAADPYCDANISYISEDQFVFEQSFQFPISAEEAEACAAQVQNLCH